MPLFHNPWLIVGLHVLTIAVVECVGLDVSMIKGGVEDGLLLVGASHCNILQFLLPGFFGMVDDFLHVPSRILCQHVLPCIGLTEWR